MDKRSMNGVKFPVMEILDENTNTVKSGSQFLK